MKIKLFTVANMGSSRQKPTGASVPVELVSVMVPVLKTLYQINVL